MSRKHTQLAALFVGTLVGCTACSIDTPNDNTGGAGATTQPSAGMSSSAGTGVGGSTPDNSGGMTPSGGMVSLGGGGASGGSGGGSAGSPMGGHGGAAPMAGAGGTGGGSTGPVNPSAGCSKATARPANGKVSVANEEIIDFPTSYDGTKPMPFLVALHACGNQNTQ